MAGSLFELDGVGADRGGKRVLDRLDLTIEGGATAVVGPSGAGKSTLLRLLNRLADPTVGAVRYCDVDVRELDPRELRRCVCLVPQLPALLAGTVADNVRYGPELAGREAEVGRALGLAGLDASFGPRAAEDLSVGEQQRVTLARALALEPDVLLLDEPTSALDERTQAGVEATLAVLVAQLGLSAVIVTHDRGQARRLARRTVTLAAGRAT